MMPEIAALLKYSIVGEEIDFGGDIDTN